MFLSLRLPQPLLLEGEAGVGKTEAAKALAAVLDTPLVRLQCYDGIDAAEALYEWNYPRQLLSIRLADTTGEKLSEETLFGRDYLIARPLLQALEHPGPRPAVLLIDEIDRADDDFEAFLLELLGEAAVTIPELGTIRATHPPAIVLTSNRTRDLHDAVKRRCLYHWIDYPSPEREVDIVRRRVKGASESLAVQVVARGRRGCATATSRSRRASPRRSTGSAALELLGVEHAGRRRDRPHARARCSSTARTRTCSARPAWSSSWGRRNEGGDRRARPAGARRRVRPAAARRGRAGDGGALGAVRRGAGARPAGRRAGGCTGPRARSSSPTRRRSSRSTRCSRRCSAARVRRAAAPRPRTTRARAGAARAAAGPAAPRGGRGRGAGDRRARVGALVARRRELRDVARAGRRQRRGAPARQAVRRARARRARPALPPDGAAAGRHAAAPHAPGGARPPRRADRPAAHAARQPAHRRRPDPARAPPPARRPPPDRAAVRHLGLDGALRPRVPAVPDLRGGRRPERRGVRVRDAADPPHARAALAQPRAGDPAGRRRPRPTGRAARGSATRCARSTTATGGAGWRAAPSS